MAGESPIVHCLGGIEIELDFQGPGRPTLRVGGVDIGRYTHSFSIDAGPGKLLGARIGVFPGSVRVKGAAVVEIVEEEPTTDPPPPENSREDV